MIRLTPINLLLGRLLPLNLLEQYNLQHFLPLIHAFQTGNIPAWRAELERNREWYRARSIWLVLYERGETLVWRNLFRLAWKDYMRLNPTVAAKSQCPIWVMLQAAQQCFKGSGELEDGDVALEDVVCAFSSLIDHVSVVGVVKFQADETGYCSRLYLVFKPDVGHEKGRRRVWRIPKAMDGRTSCFPDQRIDFARRTIHDHLRLIKRCYTTIIIIISNKHLALSSSSCGRWLPNLLHASVRATSKLGSNIHLMNLL